MQEIVDSDNEKFEDLCLFIKKETVIFFSEIFKRLVEFYRHGYLHDDFIRQVYDKKVINE